MIDGLLKRYGWKIDDFRIYVNMPNRFYNKFLSVYNKYEDDEYRDIDVLNEFLDANHFYICTIYIPFETKDNNTIWNVTTKYYDWCNNEYRYKVPFQSRKPAFEYGFEPERLYYFDDQLYNVILENAKNISGQNCVSAIYYTEFYQIYEIYEQGDLQYMILLPNNNYYVLNGKDFDKLREKVQETNLILNDIVILNTIISNEF